MIVKVFTDYACPFCYIGYELVKNVAEKTGAEFEFHFMEIHPEVADTGCPTGDIVKGDLIGFNKHIENLAYEYGIKPQLGGMISNSRKAIILRGFVVDKYPEKVDSFDEAVYKEYLVKNMDIGDDAVLGSILKSIGINEEVSHGLKNTMANIKFELDRAASKENYVESIPTFVLGNKKLIGAVKPEELIEFINTSV